MASTYDLENKLDRLALAYGLHIVEGYDIRKRVDGTTTYAQKAAGLGMWYDKAAGIYKGGGWHSLERAYYRGAEVPSGQLRFHKGIATDPPDDLFPTDLPHPGAAYYNAQLLNVDDYDPSRLMAVFKTTEVADYDGAGVQVGALDYSASPARVIADLRLRGKRNPINVNWPSYLDYRDLCAETINWDDGALTPHQVSLALHAGGALVSGTHYWVRIATLKGADISSASKDRADDGITTASILVSGGNLSFTVTWATQADRGATGYHVYIGTAEGAEDRYFTVGSGATNTLTVTTLAGATMGAPPAIATGSLLRQVPRFESHLFLPPPFGLWQAIDRIAQITCMDWHYSGGKQVFLTPEIREPIFELNVGELKGFQTYQVPRRDRYNQIIVNYRDLDQPDLRPADPPAIADRPALQGAEGLNSFEINGGCMHRSQAERVANYWARRLIDCGDFLEGEASPRTFIVLPGEVVTVPNDVPDWGDAEFYIEDKDEEDDTKAGYPIKARVNGAWYSDTDTKPLPRPFPKPNINPFTPPPVATNLALTVGNGLISSIIGTFDFGTFGSRQVARVHIKGPAAVEPPDSEYTFVKTVIPNSASQGYFEIVGLPGGKYWVRVSTESIFGQSATVGHPSGSVIIRPLAPTNLSATRSISGDWYVSATGHPRLSEKPETYIVRIRRVSDGAIMRDIPVSPGISLAAIFIEPADAIAISNNSLYGTSSLISGNAHTIQEIVQAGAVINAAFTVPAADSGYAGLRVGGVPSSFAGKWQIHAEPASATETTVTVTDSHGSWNSTTISTVDGVVYVKVVLVGTEVRFYFAGSPITATRPPDFIAQDVPETPSPAYLYGRIVGANTKIENVTMGGLDGPQTIYALGQQENDNSGSGLSTIDVEVWQTTPFGVDGLSVRGVFP